MLAVVVRRRSELRAAWSALWRAATTAEPRAGAPQAAQPPAIHGCSGISSSALSGFAKGADNGARRAPDQPATGGASRGSNQPPTKQEVLQRKQLLNKLKATAHRQRGGTDRMVQGAAASQDTERDAASPPSARSKRSAAVQEVREADVAGLSRRQMKRLARQRRHKQTRSGDSATASSQTLRRADGDPAAQLTRFKSLNTSITRDFDAAEALVYSGKLPRQELLAHCQDFIDKLGKVVLLPMDEVNIATSIHRLSRLVTANALGDLRGRLRYEEVMEVLVHRLEGLIDGQLRHQAAMEEMGAAELDAAARQAALPRPLPLSMRSLAAAFWACGHIGWPLSAEQLDKIAGYVLMRQDELVARHLSMVLLGLDAYSHMDRPWQRRLAQVLLEHASALPPEQFEARTLINVLSAAAAMGCAPSQATMDRLGEVTLTVLQHFEPGHIGCYLWTLGRMRVLPANSELVLRSISGMVWKQLDEWDAHHLGNLIYGFALMEHSPGSVFLDAVLARLRQIVDAAKKFTPQALANTSWAMARLKYTPDRESDWRTRPTFYCLKQDFRVHNENEGQLGVMWQDVQGEDGAAARAALAAGPAGWVAGEEEPFWQQSYQGLRGTLVAMARRAAERRAAAAAAAADAEAGAAAAPPPDAAAEPIDRWGLPTAKAGVRSLAERIAAARVRRAATWELVVTAEAAVREVQAKAGLAPRAAGSPPAGTASPRGTLAALAERVRQQQAAGAAPAMPAPDAPVGAAVDECSMYALVESISTGRRGGALAPAAGRAGADRGGGGAARWLLQLPPDLVVPAAEVELDDYTGTLLVRPHYDPSVVLEGSMLAAEVEGAQGAGAEEQQELGGEAEADEAQLLARILGSSSGSPLERQLESDTFRIEQQAAAGAGGAQRRLRHARSDEPEAAAPPDAAAAAELAGDGEAAPPDLDLCSVEEKEQEQQELAARDSLANEELLSHVPQEIRERWEGLPRLSLDGLADAAVSCMSRFSAQELSTLLWSFATQAHSHPQLFQAAHRHALEVVEDSGVQSMSVFLWSCAVLREKPPPELLDRILDRVTELVAAQGPNVHATANICWALAVFDHLDTAKFAALLDLLPKSDAELRAIPRPAWCQLFQSALYLEAVTGRHYSELLPPHLLPIAQANWDARDTVTSLYQKDVGSVLESMGVPHKLEFTFNERAFSVDIAVRGDDGTLLAIEVDGPHHFSSNPPFRPLASTDMRNRLLAHQGWKVVSIPTDAWRELVTLPQKQLYLFQHVLCHVRAYAPLVPAAHASS